MAETQEELKEKLAKMSPEELAAFQKQNCIFCQILEGKVPSKKVYEDDKCIGILDINPAAPGHVLLIPKEHYMVMPQMPEELIKHMFMAAKGISHAILRALKAEGTTVFVANGGAAGQRAQHFMIHIFPRNPGDDIKLEIPGKGVSDEEMKVLHEQLSKLVNQVLGGKPPVEEKKATEEKEEPEEAEEEKEEAEKEVEEKEEEPSVEDIFGKEEDEEKEEPEKKEEEGNLDEIADFLTKK